ncbi:MAG: phosphoglycerate kinase [Holosporales bacterium]|nr:phosphoglycerate kinase [Holosporales bacterium]
MIHAAFPRNKRVLARVDLNVPMDKGQVVDDTRIRLIVPTLEVLHQRGNTCILMAHLGRPKGKETQLSLQALIPVLEHFLRAPVAFVPDLMQMPKDRLESVYVLLENLRFYDGEEANDSAFAQHLARWGDFYVNEAFSASHRPHASIVGVPSFLPHTAGLLFQRELEVLQRLTERPDLPALAIVGGNKISTKFSVLQYLLEKVSVLAVGGGLANTLLAAQGCAIGQSLCEDSMLPQARTFLEKAARGSCRLILPIDVVVRTAAGVPRVCAACDIDPEMCCSDIGPVAIQRIVQEIARARTILWNGPLGRFEEPPFHKATHEVMQAIAAETQRRKILSVIGGGDSVAALNAANMDFAHFTYVSTSGGAFLEFLEGIELPGVLALK